jgi:four helix bundle protein
MQDYRKLLVWRKAHALVLNVQKSSRRFPRAGYAPLKLHLTRSAKSIPFNIVEGCGAQSRKEFARFLSISIKSANETEYQLMLARDYSVMSTADWQFLSEETIGVRKMLCGLRNKLLTAEQDK